MAVIPGSAQSLNSIAGFASAINMTTAQMTTNAEAIFQAGTWLFNTETKLVYIADGVAPIKDLKPRVDQTLTTKEKAALEAAFPDNGEYKPIANGVVVHGADGKIDNVSFSFIDKDNTRVTNEYLSFMLDDDDKVKLENLPDIVRRDWNFFDTISDRDAATPEQKRGFAFVANASDDATVGSGWALYVWAETATGSGDHKWRKIAEGEGLDLPTDMFVNYENLQKTGAVMFNHPLFMSMDLDRASNLLKTAIVPTITAENVAGAQADAVATGVSFSTGRTTPFDVEVTCTDCTINNFNGTTIENDVPKTVNGTVETINGYFDDAKIVVGATSGTVKIEWLGQTKQINVTKND